MEVTQSSEPERETNNFIASTQDEQPDSEDDIDVGPNAERQVDGESTCSDVLANSLPFKLTSYHPQKAEVTVLLIGDERSGKTSFMSLILNLLEEKGSLELRDRGNTSVEQPYQTGSTHTTRAYVYSGVTTTGQKVHLIDTPPFATINGDVVDYVAHESIYKELKKSASIDAVLILIDGTLDNLTNTTQYTLSAIATLIPDIMLGNAAFIFTNCDLSSQKLKVDSLPPMWQQSTSWAIQNPLVWCKNYHALGNQGNKRHQANQKRKLEAIYEDSTLVLGEILQWIDQRTTHPTEVISELHRSWLYINTRLKAILSASGDYERARKDLCGLRSKLSSLNKLKAAEASNHERQLELEEIITIRERTKESIFSIHKYIEQAQKHTRFVVHTFNTIALCDNFLDHIQSALKVLTTQKTNASIDIGSETKQELAEIDTYIQTLNRYLKIIDGPGGNTCVVPGLEPERSALQPLRRKQKLTLLLIGETGCGKTAFMSLLVNLFQGFGPFELEDECDGDKESGLEKQESQTTEATMYTVNAPDGTVIQILDTPGLADTRGFDQDHMHKAKINQAIQEFVTTIDAVIILANGTIERMPAATDYTLSTLTSMFPGSIIDNIGFIFTHCEPLTKNLDMNALPQELRDARNWTLENPLAYRRNYQREDEAGADQAVLEEGRKRLVTIYNNAVNTLDNWLNWVDERNPQPTIEINQLYETLVEIEAKLDAAISLMARLSEQRKELEGMQRDFDIKKDLKENLQKLKQQKTRYWDRDSTPKHNTLCIAAECYSNCHVECHVTFTLNPNELGRQCAAFGSGRFRSQEGGQVDCKECGHKAEYHRHFNDLHVFKEKELDPDAKHKLEMVEDQEQALKVAKSVVRDELDKIQERLDGLQAQIYRLVERYNGISLNKNFAGHVNSAIRMLELRLEELILKTNTADEQKVVGDAIHKLRKKLDVLGDPSVNKKGKERGYFLAGCSESLKRMVRWH